MVPARAGEHPYSHLLPDGSGQVVCRIILHGCFMCQDSLLLKLNLTKGINSLICMQDFTV